MRTHLKSIIRSIVFVVGVLFVLTCVKTPVNDEPPRDDSSLFVIESRNNPEGIDQNIPLVIYPDSSAIGLVPLSAYNVGRDYVMTFNVPDGSRVYVGGVEQVSRETSQDFGQPLQYKIVHSDGSVENYQLELYPNTEIPVFWVETENKEEVTSKDDYLGAALKINPGSSYEQEQLIIPTEIRGRGNSTWGMPKKPYRLRFRQATEVLGMSATRNWVLLANYADKTLLRNFVAFEMGQRLMEGFTPRTRFVEVYINGAYMGSYHLTDQIRVEETRVHVDELQSTDNTADIITGGYLLEIDERLDEENWWHTSQYHIPFTYKNPEFPNDAQREYIETYIQEFEDMLADPEFGSGEHAYEDYIDVPSFVSWYLVNEVMKNNDAAQFSSIFMHKPRNGKLQMGPLWDFDIAAGNINYNGNEDPEGWWIQTNSNWYARLFEDQAFRQAVKKEWVTFKGTHFQALLDAIDEAAFNTLRFSQQWNFQRWPILDEHVWPNAVVLGSYDAEVEYLKDWLRTRVDWMDGHIMGW